MIEHETNYEFKEGMVVFKNDSKITGQNLNALHFIKGESTNVTSFLWQELLRLDETNDTLTIHFLRANFNRNKKYLEKLADSNFFQMQTMEVNVRGLPKIQVEFTGITPEFKSIIKLL